MTYYSVYRARDALREKEEEYQQLKRDIEDLRTKLSNDNELKHSLLKECNRLYEKEQELYNEYKKLKAEQNELERSL